MLAAVCHGALHAACVADSGIAERRIVALCHCYLPQAVVISTPLSWSCSHAFLAVAQVVDDVEAIMDNVTMLAEAADDLVQLRFNLTAFRSTFSQQILAGA